MVTCASGWSFWTAIAMICAVVWRVRSRFWLLSFVGKSNPKRSSAVVSSAASTASAAVFVLISILENCDVLLLTLLLWNKNEFASVGVTYCLLNERRIDVPNLLFLNDIDMFTKQQSRRTATNRLCPIPWPWNKLTSQKLLAPLSVTRTVEKVQLGELHHLR